VTAIICSVFVILHEYLHRYLIFIEYKLQIYLDVSAQKIV